MALASPAYSFAPCRAAPFTDNKDSFTPLYSDLTDEGWHKVWENPNPNVAFGEQAILFTDNDYDEYLIVTKTQAVDTLTHNGATEGAILGWHSPSANVIGFSLRAFLNVARTGMTFGVCYAVAPNGGVTVNNVLSVPIAVYGSHLKAQ